MSRGSSCVANSDERPAGRTFYLHECWGPCTLAGVLAKIRARCAPTGALFPCEFPTDVDSHLEAPCDLVSAPFPDCTDHPPFSGWTGDLGSFASPNAGRFWRGTAFRAFSGWHSRTLHYRLRSLRPRKRLCQRSNEGRADPAGAAPARRSAAGSLQQ